MNDREMELLIMIRENRDPAVALEKAVQIVAEYIRLGCPYEVDLPRLDTPKSTV